MGNVFLLTYTNYVKGDIQTKLSIFALPNRFLPVGPMFNLSPSKFLTKPNLRCVMCICCILKPWIDHRETQPTVVHHTFVCWMCVYICWFSAHAVFQHCLLFRFIGHWFLSNYDYQQSKIGTLLNIVRVKDVFIFFSTISTEIDKFIIKFQVIWFMFCHVIS